MKIIYGIALPLISLATGSFGIVNRAVIQTVSTTRTNVVFVSSSDITRIQNNAIGGYVQHKADLYSFAPPVTTTVAPQRALKHGDCSWLAGLALQAGWPAHDIKQLQHIALRESGCCPNRAGGDIVDKNCNITGIAERTHRSDSGLLQINGVNYDPKRNKWAPVCLEMNVCTQEPLFDPLTNLRAGKLLYDYWKRAAGDGWIPWDSCNRTRTCK